MQYDKRDIRAIVFSCDELATLRPLQAILQPKDWEGARKPVPIKSNHPTIEGFSIPYQSENCYFRSQDPTKKREYAEMKKQGIKFEYDILVLLDSRTSPPLVLIGIPFSNMAIEVFGRIHNARPNDTFKYHRPKLAELVAALQTSAGSATHLKAVGVSWLNTGETAKCSEVILEGTDVVHSEVFNLMETAKKGIDVEKRKLTLSLTLRKLYVSYENLQKAEDLDLSFDRFGNYMVWVTDEGKNLPLLLDVVYRLRKSKLLAEEKNFPVRNRADEPRL
jgi:hypothetical protein